LALKSIIDPLIYYYLELYCYEPIFRIDYFLNNNYFNDNISCIFYNCNIRLQ